MATSEKRHSHSTESELPSENPRTLSVDIDMKKRTKEGHCSICGEFTIMTFEHVPPNCSFNNKPIFMQSVDHLWDENSVLYGKKMTSSRGLGGYTLCQDCNNKTGAWYAKDFCDFAKQGMEILQAERPEPRIVQGTYIIKPLNVFKQIMTMFMSADKSGYLRSREDVRHFLLEPQKRTFPSDFKVYIYSNASPFKRFAGYSVIYDPDRGINKWSEINFQPFGYLLAENSKPANEFMIDITAWSENPYDQVRQVKMTTCYLKVTNLLVGAYE